STLLIHYSPIYRPFSHIPTRRSSDLRYLRDPRPAPGRGPEAADVALGAVARIEPAPRVRNVDEDQRTEARQVAWRRDSRAPRTRDRKSTRLNSSHSQISYAVFCLKKK